MLRCLMCDGRRETMARRAGALMFDEARISPMWPRKGKGERAGPASLRWRAEMKQKSALPFPIRCTSGLAEVCRNSHSGQWVLDARKCRIGVLPCDGERFAFPQTVEVAVDEGDALRATRHIGGEDWRGGVA